MDRTTARAGTSETDPPRRLTEDDLEQWVIATKNPTQARLSMSIALCEAASRCVPIEVEQVMEHLEPAILEIEASANRQLDKLQSRIKDLQEQLRWKERECAALDRTRRRSEADAAAAAVTTSRSPLENPWGFYVYYLWGDGDLLLYVGKSTNLLNRLGSHIGDPRKRRAIARITVVEHPDEDAMARAEGCAIRELRPQWNVMGVRDEAAA